MSHRPRRTGKPRAVTNRSGLRPAPACVRRPTTPACVRLPQPVSDYPSLCADTPACVRLLQPVSDYPGLRPTTPPCVRLPRPVSDYPSLCPTTTACARLPHPVSDYPALCPPTPACVRLPQPVSDYPGLCPATPACVRIPLGGRHEISVTGPRGGAAPGGAQKERARSRHRPGQRNSLEADRAPEEYDANPDRSVLD